MLAAGRTLRILAVEDNADHAGILRFHLSRTPQVRFDFVHAATATAARRALGESDFDLVFLDYQLGGSTGLDLLHEIRARGVDCPVVVVTSQGDEYVAVDMIRHGADDYIVKQDLGPDILARTLTRLGKRLEKSGSASRRRLDSSGAMATLTTREREVLALIVSGKTNRAIAAELWRSEKTIKVHRANIMRKMGASNAAELVRMAMGQPSDDTAAN